MYSVVTVLVAALLLTACGQDPAPAPEIPSWAKVAPEQIEEAKKHGVPVAFENELGMRFVLIPAGTFLMGSPEAEEGRYGNEGPQHKVTLLPFYLATAEVTNAQYRRFRAEHDSGTWEYGDCNGEDQPVATVNYADAGAFAKWLSALGGGREYRLPSEAEWEYACRAGTRTRFWAGNREEDLERVGWYVRNSGSQRLSSTAAWDWDKAHNEWGCVSHAVGQKGANPWGLLDMHGNVLEWCQDEYREDYEGAP